MSYIVSRVNEWTVLDVDHPDYSWVRPPARHKQVALNLSVRKTADNLWLQWRSTRGPTWAVDKAGILELGE